jgi:type VI secretion system protein ImpF
MAELLAQERLQPCLLDRLVDEAPQEAKEAADKRFLNKAQLRKAVLRDLEWLLNCTRPADAALGGQSSLVKSVAGFGLPGMSGQTASSVSHQEVERAVRGAIELFEPRIDASTLEVNVLVDGAAIDSHNVLELELKGTLWAQPTPLELIVRTAVSLETGQVQVIDQNVRAR